jgi:hypothetical protein
MQDKRTMADYEKEKVAAVVTTEEVRQITTPQSLSTPLNHNSAGLSEKQTQFGASVQPIATPKLLAPSDSHLKPKISLDVPSSPVSISSTSDQTPSKPTTAFSPFYNHPPCSFEQSKTSKSKLGIYTHDVESQAALHGSTGSPKISIEPTRDCAMWPSQKELKRRAKADKKRKCECLPKISKRLKIMLGVGAFLFIIALALVLGFVISKKVGGGIYLSASKPNAPVPQRMG